MKQIDLKFTEDILTPYGITVENVADANEYQEQVANPDYVPAVGREKIVDPAWDRPDDFDDLTGDMPMIDNPDHTPAVGEQTFDNPESRTEFLAKKIPALGMEAMIAKVMQPQIAEAEQALVELRKKPAQVAAAIVEQMTKNVKE